MKKNCQFDACKKNEKIEDEMKKKRDEEAKGERKQRNSCSSLNL